MTGINPGLIGSVALLMFFAELPDKTSLAALYLGRKLPRYKVLIGAWAALVLQVVISVLIGATVYRLAGPAARIISVVVMAAAALVLIYRAIKDDEDDDSQSRKLRSANPIVITFVVIFLAELGDITEFLTAGLTASSKAPLSIGIGASIGMMAASGTSIAASRLSEKIPDRVANGAGGAILLVLAALVLAGFHV